MWLITLSLLTVSNIFMTFAWYGHLRHKQSALWLAVLVRGYPKSDLAPDCLKCVMCSPLFSQTKESAHGNAYPQNVSE